MGEIFEKWTHTSEAFFLGCQQLESPPLCVLSYFAKLSMTTLVNKKTQFKKIACALYATDIINCPSGNMLEGKVYFSGKHKLYEFKTEVSVTPSGQEVNVQTKNQAASQTLLFFKLT